MKCAICRTADATGCFHGEMLGMPICDRCAKIGSAFIATGYIGSRLTSSPEAIGGSSLIDSLLRSLRGKGLVDEEDVKGLRK